MAETKENKHKSELKEEFYGNRCGLPGLWVESEVDGGEHVLEFETGDVSHIKLNIEGVLKLRDLIEKWLMNQTFDFGGNYCGTMGDVTKDIVLKYIELQKVKDKDDSSEIA
jgi:hypothetical protein